jgi:5-methylthioadenosine/S-adenosylhomocysteine deaminase
MADLLISGCDILQVSSGEVSILTGQDIAVDGTRITQIVSTGSLSSQSFSKVIHAGGMLAVPGLINTHAHVPMALFRGLVEDVTVEAWFNDYIWPLESNLTDEDVYWGALLGIAEMIEAGVTTVADHYFAMDEAARAVADSGIRGHLAWAVFGHEGEEKLDRTCQFIERWQGQAGGRITAWLGPHAPYTTGIEFLRLAAGRAKELGVGIHTHVSETADQVRLSLEQHGMTPIQMLAESQVLEVPTLLAHCLYPTDEDIQILSRVETAVAHAPKTYLKLGMGAAPLAKFRRAGIPVGLATDGPVSSNTLDILEQLRLMVLVQKSAAGDPTVMPVAEALEIAFQGGAWAVRQGDDLGSLEPGKLADIVLLRQDGLHIFPRFNPAANLVYSSRSADVDTVICNGRILLLNGELQTIDKALVKRQVSQRLERLSQRVPGKRIATYPA